MMNDVVIDVAVFFVSFSLLLLLLSAHSLCSFFFSVLLKTGRSIRSQNEESVCNE